MVPMNQQPPLPVVPPLLNPFVMQQLLQSQANAMSQFYGLPSYAGPADQGMAPTQQIQHQYYHRAPTSGPRRNQRGGFREAEPLHPNQFLYESSRTVADGRSTGIDPGNAWINSNDNPRVRKVWRTPSKNPLFVDHNLTQQIRKSPYRRDNRPYRGPLTRDDVGPSGYVIPTADTKSRSISLSTLYRLTTHCRRGDGR